MKLQSMVDYVLGLNGQLSFNDVGFLSIKYAEFLGRALSIQMFVPADVNGNILFEPAHIYSDHPDKEHSKMHQNSDIVQSYKEAQERVLFSGFTYKRNAPHLILLIHNGKDIFNYNSSTESFLLVGSTIEDLVKYNLELTPTAIKELNL